MCQTESRRAARVDTLFNWLADYDDWLFDLDNTLFEQSAYDACVFADIEAWLAAAGCSVEGLAQHLLRQKTQQGAQDPKLFDRVLAQWGIDQHWLPAVIERYRQARPDFHTSQSLVAALSEHLTGHRLFIVTNGHAALQAHKVRCLGLDRLATEVVYCDKYQPQRLKPSLWAWQQLNEHHQLSHPVFVGDSWETDAGFAANAGIDFIQFRYRP